MTHQDESNRPSTRHGIAPLAYSLSPPRIALKLAKHSWVWRHTHTFFFFFNITFLLTLWEFHRIYHDQLTSQSFHVTSLPPQSPNKKKGKYRSTLCCSNTHWSMVKPQWPAPLGKLSPSPPAPLPEAINCGELHLSIPITIFKSSL